MKFNIFKKDPKGSSVKDMKHFISLMGQAWQKTHTLLFFVFFIALVVLGGYLWQKSLYKGAWSDQRKQEYLNSQGKGVVFKEDDFKKVTADIQARQEENARPYQPLKDIFKSY